MPRRWVLTSEHARRPDARLAWPRHKPQPQRLTPGNERRFTYGHSLIADPWGHIIAKASDGEGFACARVDAMFLEQCRAAIPVADHKVIGREMEPVRLGKRR